MTQRPRHIPNLAERAWDEMPSVYRGADRMEALIRAQACAAQVLEDHASDIQFSTGWGEAEGDALDQWGRSVGLGRSGLPDRTYRRLVEAKILASHASGTPDDLVDIYRTATGAREVRYWEHPNAGARLEAYRDDWMSDPWAHAVPRVLDVARPAGTRLSLVESIPERLTLDDEPDGQLLSRTL